MHHNEQPVHFIEREVSFISGISAYDLNKKRRKATISI